MKGPEESWKGICSTSQKRLGRGPKRGSRPRQGWEEAKKPKEPRKAWEEVQKPRKGLEAHKSRGPTRAPKARRGPEKRPEALEKTQKRL